MLSVLEAFATFDAVDNESADLRKSGVFDLFCVTGGEIFCLSMSAGFSSVAVDFKDSVLFTKADPFDDPVDFLGVTGTLLSLFPRA